MGRRERPYHKSPQTKTCDRTRAVPLSEGPPPAGSPRPRGASRGFPPRHAPGELGHPHLLAEGSLPSVLIGMTLNRCRTRTNPFVSLLYLPPFPFSSTLYPFPPYPQPQRQLQQKQIHQAKQGKLKKKKKMARLCSKERTTYDFMLSRPLYFRRSHTRKFPRGQGVWSRLSIS